MGQAQTEICPVHMTSKEVIEQLEKRFIICPHPIYTNRQDFKLLHERLTNRQFMLRVLTVDQHQKRVIEAKILKRLAFKNSTLTKIQHYIFQTMDSYCSTQFKIYILFQLNPTTTLREYILMQGKGQEYLTEKQIIRGFQNLMEGILWIRYLKEKHGNINTHHIYCNNGKMVLVDPLLCPQSQEFPEKYPSPQKLKAMSNNAEQYSPHESDIFSAAMCMLQIVPGVRMNGVYKRNYSINENNLKQEIDKCSQYPKLKALLMNLLLEPYGFENRKRYLELYSYKCSFLLKNLGLSQSGSSRTASLQSFGKSTKPKQLIRLQIGKKNQFGINQIAQMQEIDARDMPENDGRDMPEIDTKMLQNDDVISSLQEPQQWHQKRSNSRPYNSIMNRNISTRSSIYEPSVRIFFNYLNPK